MKKQMKLQTVEIWVVGIGTLLIAMFVDSVLLSTVLLAFLFGYLLKCLFILLGTNSKTESKFKNELYSLTNINSRKDIGEIRLMFKNNEPFLWEAKVGKKKYISPLDREGVLEI